MGMTEKNRLDEVFDIENPIVRWMCIVWILALNNHNHPFDSNMVDVESDTGAGQPMDEIVSPPTQMSYDDITRLLAVTTMRADIYVSKERNLVNVDTLSGLKLDSLKCQAV